ncbi:MAG: cyclase family protein [Bacteroidales bacterium]|nr:cyclase family protein [Bacteroidales bacterium]MCF8334876.1 cyclase family protein [Bacteroidales bacterium]
MKVIDLSHTINNDITVFNEAERPQIKQVAAVEKDGYSQMHFSMYTHNSTHIDAPYHMIAGAKALDQLNPTSFVGKAFVADVRGSGSLIHTEDLNPYQSKLEECDFIILHTGWANKWKTDAYKKDFPVLSQEAAKWLMRFNLKGIGLDTISIDPVDSVDVPIHKIVLGNEVLIVENLTNLEALGDEVFTFSSLPLKFENADGSPVRAVGMTNSF